jgi:hypothetical protein
MKIFLMLFLSLNVLAQAQGGEDENKTNPLYNGGPGAPPPSGRRSVGYFGSDDLFTNLEKAPIPENAFNPQLCLTSIRKFRTVINRVRSISFQIERKCLKGNKDLCAPDLGYLKTVMKTLNRYVDIFSNSCTGPKG